LMQVQPASRAALMASSRILGLSLIGPKRICLTSLPWKMGILLIFEVQYYLDGQS
jgi:hypothetical protein